MKLEAWEQRIRLEEREEGIAEGELKGETAKLASLISRKIKKGKTPEETAEDLDEDIGEVRRIYDVVARHCPDYDMEKILAELLDKS